MRRNRQNVAVARAMRRGVDWGKACRKMEMPSVSRVEARLADVMRSNKPGCMRIMIPMVSTIFGRLGRRRRPGSEGDGEAMRWEEEGKWGWEGGGGAYLPEGQIATWGETSPQHNAQKVHENRRYLAP